MPDLFEKTHPPPAFLLSHGLFADLDPSAACFCRIAAERVVSLTDANAIDKALKQLEGGARVIVETLAILGIAMRIARMPELADRRNALEKLVPEDLRARTEPHIKRFYLIKPWRHRDHPMSE